MAILAEVFSDARPICQEDGSLPQSRLAGRQPGRPNSAGVFCTR